MERKAEISKSTLLAMSMFFLQEKGIVLPDEMSQNNLIYVWVGRGR